jgi:hypothetical protein
MKKSNTIKTAIIGVLCYLIIVKSFDLLSRIFTWIEVKFEIYKIKYLFLAYVIIGLGSVRLLLFLYNRYLKKGNENWYYIMNIKGSNDPLGMSHQLVFIENKYARRASHK